MTDHPAHQRKLGVVFQSDALFPHLSEPAPTALAPGQTVRLRLQGAGGEAGR